MDFDATVTVRLRATADPDELREGLLKLVDLLDRERERQPGQWSFGAAISATDVELRDVEIVVNRALPSS